MTKFSFPRFPTAREATLKLRPDQPVYCFRRSVLEADTRAFLDVFPGKTAYAVKTNGEPFVLETVAKAGVTAFDVASPAEFKAVADVAPKAEMLYMHPVKAQSDIRLALETYGITEMAVDHEDEVAKVLRLVRALDLDPADLTLFVRLHTKGHAAYELSKKFGAAPGHAVELLKRIDNIGFKTGLCFHVGSQVEEAHTYSDALKSAAWVRARAGVEWQALDVGGGFPAAYGRDPRQRQKPVPDLSLVMDELNQAIRDHDLDDLPLVAEPGRVVVARCLSVIVRVLLRDGKRIYINDGIWGSLSDSWTGKITLPARLIPDPARRTKRRKDATLQPFRVCGATCDSVDILSRPFWLPDTVETGDFIEIGHIGAYSLALRTRFNGFYPDTMVEVDVPFEEEGAPDGFANVETGAA